MTTPAKTATPLSAFTSASPSTSATASHSATSSLSRRNFVKLAGTAAAAASLGGLLTACSGGAGSGAGSSSSAGSGAGSSSSAGSGAGACSVAGGTDTVVVAMSPGSEPAAGFDPCIAWGCGEHVHEPLIQSTLITTNTDLEFVNDLATSYSCSPDGMTWTFTIRDDVKFTDGVPLTAADVAFTINTINASPSAQADLSMIQEAVAINDTTVELHMAKPNNALLYTLAVVGIVPEHAYDQSYGANPIGSGRYMLEQWDQGQQVIFTANPDYYGEAPTMQRVIVIFMSEDAALSASTGNSVDIAYTSAVLADAVPAGYDLLNCASVDSRGISLPVLPEGSPQRTGMDGADHPVGNNATCNLELRQAMNLGVNRQAMIDHVLNGYGSEAYSVGDGMPWSSPDMQVAFNPTAAHDLLSEAGWKAGDDGILIKNGQRAQFSLLYAAGDSVRQALAMEFSNQMADLGIQVDVAGGDWDTDLYPHQFDTPILWGWGSNSPVELYELTYSTGWGNVACYDNPVVDDYLDEALSQTEIQDSYDYYQRAQWDPDTQTGVAPQGASTWIWLANVDHLYFKRQGLHVADQKPHPHGHGWSLVNNVDQWSWQ